MRYNRSSVEIAVREEAPVYPSPSLGVGDERTGLGGLVKELHNRIIHTVNEYVLSCSGLLHTSASRDVPVNSIEAVHGMHMLT